MLVYLPVAQMNRIILIIMPLLAQSLSCARGQILPGEARPEAFACFEDACNNAIDPVVNTAFTCRLTPVSLAPSKELCRRLFVDTLGRLPTDEDFAAQCDGKTLDQTIEALFALPEYPLARQKAWAKRFGYNDARSWYQDTIGLDLLVRDLYAGTLSIGDFVVRAAIHPAVLTSADGSLTDQVTKTANPHIDARTLSKGPSADGFVERVFETLLFRSPTELEIAEFPNLYRQFEIDPVANDPDLPGFKARQLKIAPCNCAGSKKSFCQTQAIGVRDVSLPLPFPGAADCAAEPGNSYTFKQLTTDEKFVTARDVLRTPGLLLLDREDFYKQYAKEALDRLLGYDVLTALGPTLGDATLQALADSFKTDGSVRNLEANIMRSVFYRQSQTPESPAVDCDGKASPLYAGPRKRLDAEAFIASATAATNHDFGKCDYRLQTRTYAKQVNNVPINAWAPPTPISQYPIKDTETSEPDFTFRDIAQTVGACPNNVTKITILDTGAFTLMGYDFIAREACEKGDKGAPAGNDTSDPALAATVDYQFNRFFLEAPTADEKTAGLTAMKGCLASTQTCTADMVGKRLCAALLKSSRFLTY